MDVPRSAGDEAFHTARIVNLRRAIGGERFDAAWKAGEQLAKDAAIALASEAAGDRRTYHLTLREGQIVALMVQGRTAKQMAAALGLSARTVEGHLAHIYQKLGVSGRNEAIGLALGQGYRAPTEC
jgi:DNA-binding CsgD family transcriptional regulator